MSLGNSPGGNRGLLYTFIQTLRAFRPSYSVVCLLGSHQFSNDSNIFSLTFRKLFGEFGKGTIPPIIAKKSENEDIVKIDLPERTEEEIIKEGEKSLEELEKNIEIVLKDNPSEDEVAKVYKSMSESLVSKKENVQSLQASAKKLGVKEFRIIPLQQGNKVTRIVCWQFSKPQ